MDQEQTEHQNKKTTFSVHPILEGLFDFGTENWKGGGRSTASSVSIGSDLRIYHKRQQWRGKKKQEQSSIRAHSCNKIQE